AAMPFVDRTESVIISMVILFMLATTSLSAAIPLATVICGFGATFTLILAPLRARTKTGSEIRTVEGISVNWRVFLSVMAAASVIAAGVFIWAHSYFNPPATLWDTGGRVVARLESDGVAQSAVPSPDGEYFALSVGDFVKLYTARTGALLAEIAVDRYYF